jgi:hypothetical protein
VSEASRDYSSHSPTKARVANSAGLQGCVIYRDGIYLGSPPTPKWHDITRFAIDVGDHRSIQPVRRGSLCRDILADFLDA